MAMATEAPASNTAEGPTSHTQNQSPRFSPYQLRMLHGGINGNRVRNLRGMSHLEAWDVRRQLIRVFGFGGFDIETVSLDLVAEHEKKQGEKSRWTVVYRAQVRLILKDSTGTSIAYFDDGAAGDSVNQPSLGDAHDMAMKGLALDTPIPTPVGWTTMGALSVGDTVFDKYGQPVRVMATSPVKNLDCFRVTFRNGRSIVCDAEHYWVAKVAQEKTKAHTIGSLFAAKQAGKPVVIPVAEPLEGPAAALPVDPWVFGYWLGNGACSSARVTCHGDDVAEVAAAVASAGYEVGTVRPDPRGHASTFTIRGLSKVMADMGLLGSKHVPAEYLRGSVEQRRALLAGLMDSDGSADKRGRVVFTSTTKVLTDAVAELARSLGETVTRSEIERTGYGKTVLSYDVQWTPMVAPFALSRKANRLSPRSKGRYGHRVASIERIDSVPTRCISVDSPSRTYLASEDMIPTHNTSLSQALKRCAVNLGDQFGLSLYNDGSQEPVVVFSAAHPPQEWKQQAQPPEPEPVDPPVKPEPSAPQDSEESAPAAAPAATAATGRDYLQEARAAADAETVRTIYRAAQNDGAVPEYLAQIAEVGKAKSSPAATATTAPAGPDPIDQLMVQVQRHWGDFAELTKDMAEASRRNQLLREVDGPVGTPMKFGDMVTARIADLKEQARLAEQNGPQRSAA